MAKKSKSDRWHDVHTEALQRFDRVQSQTYQMATQAQSDRIFAKRRGGQWQGLLQDPDEQRVHLEINRVHGSLIRLEGEFRNNPCTVEFLPVDEPADGELADAANGIWRADCEACDADEAFDNAFSEGAAGGKGGVALTECYQHDIDGDADYDESDFPEGDAPPQRIRIEPVFEADVSMFFDPDSQQQNKADARWAFNVKSMTWQGFKDRFGEDKDPSTWPKTQWVTEWDWQWVTPDLVYVAEYYVVEDKKEDWVRLEHPMQPDEPAIKLPASAIDPEEGDDEAAEERRLRVSGWEVVRRYKKKVRKVTRYVMSGAEVLEEQKIAGRYIPLVPYFATHDIIEGVETYAGVTRVARDPQTLVNTLTSWLAEVAARTPIPVPVMSPEQMVGHQASWSEHPTRPKPFLLLNLVKSMDGEPLTAQPVVQNLEAAQLPPALSSLLMLIGADLKELTGSQEQREKVMANVSGKALELHHQQLDAMTLIYLDNYKKFMRQVGVVYKSKARALYVETGRRMRALAADGKTRSTVTIGEPGVTKSGAIRLNGIVNLEDSDFDVRVSVGPSTASRRNKVVGDLTAVLPFIPPEDVRTRTRIVAKIMASLQGEGMDDLNEAFTMDLLREGVGKPNSEQAKQLQQEAQQRAQQPPDPNTKLASAMADKETALAQKAAADAAQSGAKVGLVEAQRVHTLAQAEKLGVDTVLDVDAAMRAPDPRQAPPNGAA